MNRLNSSVILLALVLPTVVTLAYFVLLAGQASTLQQAAYGGGKAVQFALPAICTALVLRERIRAALPDRRGLLMGLCFGLPVATVMLGLYHMWLKPAGLLASAGNAVSQKVLDLGMNTPWRFAAMGLFYASCHSLLEEYYWRWFVFSQLRRRQTLPTAILISSCGFMAHHVIVLGTFFGWTNPMTYLFSLAVAAGGAAWAWIYERSGSLYGPWLSHLLVDAAIFLIGYDLVRCHLG